MSRRKADLLGKTSLVILLRIAIFSFVVTARFKILHILILILILILLLLHLVVSSFLPPDFFLTTLSSVLELDCSLFQTRICSCKSFRFAHCKTKYWPPTSYFKRVLQQKKYRSLAIESVLSIRNDYFHLL